MTQNRTATVFTSILLLQFFLFSLCQNYVFACDGDDFVYEEFGQRCLKMSELIRQFQMSKKMNLPDRDKFKRQLLNEWVDFFLDHGNMPPGGFSNIATDTWSLTISEVGQYIGKMAYQNLPYEQSMTACIPFDLLGQPIKLSNVRTAIESWRTILNEPNYDTIASEGMWIGKNIRSLISVVEEFSATYPSEKVKTKKFIASINQDWLFVLKADKNVSQTLFKYSCNEIRQKMKNEFEHWRKLAFLEI